MSAQGRVEQSGSCSPTGFRASSEPKVLGWTSSILPPRFSLTGSEIHIWLVDLREQAEGIAACRETLSADERSRAESFHFQRDRDRFVVARGALRTILGRYLEERPEQLRFTYNSFGKPALPDTSRHEALEFNLSHSGDVALCAVALGRRLGIDVERVREDFCCEEIAEHFFSGREVATLRALPEAERPHAFFRCWTRKEAYIKARGEGLSIPLDSFSVSLGPGEPAELLSVDGPPEAARWTLIGLEPRPGYAAAVAFEGDGRRLSCRMWGRN
jgi:4'-phosphopantetheinyl transferase